MGFRLVLIISKNCKVCIQLAFFFFPTPKKYACLPLHTGWLCAMLSSEVGVKRKYDKNYNCEINYLENLEKLPLHHSRKSATGIRFSSGFVDFVMLLGTVCSKIKINSSL